MAKSLSLEMQQCKGLLSDKLQARKTEILEVKAGSQYTLKRA